MRLLTIALALNATTGCYFFYPDIPKTRAPAVAPGEDVKIEVKDVESSERCDPGSRHFKDADCQSSDGKRWYRPVTSTEFAATYRGDALTQYQLRQLVDPEFKKRIDHIKGRKAVCNISLVPSAIALVAGVVGTVAVAGAGDGTISDTRKWLIIGGYAGAIGGGLLSYPLGGFACTKAAREWKAMFHEVPEDATTFTVWGERETYVEQIQKLTESFNRQFGSGAASRDREESKPAEDGENSGGNDDGEDHGNEADGANSPPPAEPSGSTFTLVKKEVAPGARVELVFDAPMKALPGERYWATIVERAAADDAYDDYIYVRADAERAEMSAPKKPGRYEVRLHGNYPTKKTNLLFRAELVVKGKH